MTQGGRGTPSRTRADRTVRSPPVTVPPAALGKQRRVPHRPAPDAALQAAGEKSQLEFQRIFGVNFKAARLKSHLKQSDVAAVTGLPQQYISLIEAGQQNVTIRTMALLAKVVDHDLLALLKEALRDPSKEA